MNTERQQRLYLVVIQHKIFTLYAGVPEDVKMTATEMAKYEFSPFSHSTMSLANMVVDLKTKQPLKFRYEDRLFTPEVVEMLWGMAKHLSSRDDLKNEIVDIWPEQSYNPWL